MLVSSKNKNEKIVLGLLSYTYGEEGATSEELLERLNYYREVDDIAVLLYQEEGSDNYIGLMVVEVDEGEADIQTVTLQRFALLPSHRDAETAYEMYMSLRDYYPEANVIGRLSLSDKVSEWTQRYQGEVD